jgi:hypothetical protein
MVGDGRAGPEIIMGAKSSHRRSNSVVGLLTLVRVEEWHALVGAVMVGLASP